MVASCQTCLFMENSFWQHLSQNLCLHLSSVFTQKAVLARFDLLSLDLLHDAHKCSSMLERSMIEFDLYQIKDIKSKEREKIFHCTALGFIPLKACILVRLGWSEHLSSKMESSHHQFATETQQLSGGTKTISFEDSVFSPSVLHHLQYWGHVFFKRRAL